MSRRVSLNYRQSMDASETAEIEVVLIHITHPEIAAPLRLSTDPTTRLSVEPLIYGTRSTWKDSDPATEPFEFVLLSVLMPDDNEDTPPAARLSVAAFDADLAKSLRSTNLQATVSMAVVLASAPDLVEYEIGGLKLVGADGNASEITLEFSRDPLTSEPSPFRRMTRATFPGLHR